MAAATVRLYRANPSTNAFEPVEGGTPLGCVVMGTGVTFQILVYNGQVRLLLPTILHQCNNLVRTTVAVVVTFLIVCFYV